MVGMATRGIRVVRAVVREATKTVVVTYARHVDQSLRRGQSQLEAVRQHNDYLHAMIRDLHRQADVQRDACQRRIHELEAKLAGLASS